MKIGLGIGIPNNRTAVSGGGATFPDTISNPIERAIVSATGLDESTYNSTGITTVCAAWYEGDDVTGSPITSITDKSGNGRQLNNANGTGNVTSVASAINGEPVIRFPGTKSLYSNASTTNYLDAESSFFLLYTSNSAEAIEGVFTEQREIGTRRIALYADTRNSIFVAFNFSPDSTGRLVSYASEQAAGTRLVSVHRVSTTSTFYSDGAEIGSVAAAVTFDDGPDRSTFFEMGRQETGAFYFNGDVAIALVISAPLTLAQHQEIQSAIAGKYGITLA